MYECLDCVYLSAPCVWLVPAKVRRGLQISWNWSYGCFFCESVCGGAENWAHILCTRNKCFNYITISPPPPPFFPLNLGTNLSQLWIEIKVPEPEVCSDELKRVCIAPVSREFWYLWLPCSWTSSHYPQSAGYLGMDLPLGAGGGHKGQSMCTM